MQRTVTLAFLSLIMIAILGICRGYRMPSRKLVIGQSLRFSSDNCYDYQLIETAKDGLATLSVVRCIQKTTFLSDVEKVVTGLRERQLITAEELNTIPRDHASNRLNVFLGGRLAAKYAIQSISGSSSFPMVSLPRNELGAPVFPAGWTGSISHKNDLAVAAVTSSSLGFSIGVDIEKFTNRAAEKLQRRILTENEQSSLGTVIADIEKDVMLRFSFKEAVYKALNPMLRRYIDFKEVEVIPQENNQAIIKFILNDNHDELKYCRKCSASWRCIGEDYVITTVGLHS